MRAFHTNGASHARMTELPDAAFGQLKVGEVLGSIHVIAFGFWGVLRSEASLPVWAAIKLHTPTEWMAICSMRARVRINGRVLDGSIADLESASGRRVQGAHELSGV